MHQKEVYTLIDCLGDLGGLIEIIYFTSCLLIKPISYHSFILKAISKLYIVRISHPKSSGLKSGASKNRDGKSAVKMRLRDSFKLFLINKLPYFKKYYPSVKQLSKIFNEGEDRIEK